MYQRLPEYSTNCKIYDLKKEAVKNDLPYRCHLQVFSLYFFLPQNAVHNFGAMGHCVVFFYDRICTTVQIRQGSLHTVKCIFV